jgi:hypothetical protein
LVWASIGELTGTDNEITQHLVHDNQFSHRFNHLNVYNNKVLAEFILGSIYNYNPGQYEISLSIFDQVNPNSVQWPDPGFGTK